jgi:acetyl-CoA carboxylase biotin carboxyl carrier protein
MSKSKAGGKPTPPPSRLRAAVAPPAGDLKLVRDLARIANEYDLEEIEILSDGGIRISRVPTSAPRGYAEAAPPSLVPHIGSMPTPLSHASVTAIPAASPALVAASDDVLITSPFVGTFYRAASPDKPSFVEVGQTIRKGQVVCIVEAMKLMNEIEAEADGKLVEVLTKNGEHVEYGQPLFRLAKL